ncbi:cytochrome c [Cytophagaceae bacterium ABcell3]|nr:cytochrome c [Cytophagaceae bacterium ABcell3]
MKTLATATGILMLIFTVKLSAQDLANGQKIFDTRCKSCHKIGGGDFVGPDLKDVHTNRKEEWLIQFIQSPASLIEAGDEEAVALYEKFNKVMMPDHKDLDDESVKDLIAYIGDKSAPAKEETKEATVDKAEEKAAVVAPQNQSASPLQIFIYSLIGVAFILIAVIMYMLMTTMRLIKANSGKQ